MGKKCTMTIFISFNLYQMLYRDQISEDELGETSSPYWIQGKYTQNFGREI
jgi:hypothetical protein